MLTNHVCKQNGDQNKEQIKRNSEYIEFHAFNR